MKKPVRLIAMWLLLLALPLQGLAAFTSARCVEAPPAHAMHDNHQNHHGAASQTHDHGIGHTQQGDDQPADQTSGHSCCHHVFSGAAATGIPGMPVPPRGITPRVLLLTTLHIPELPQRPPRA